MKTALQKVIVCASCLTLTQAAFGNIVGYINLLFRPGVNLIADQLLRLFARHDEMFFLTYTNGTLLDDALCRQHGGAHGAAVGEDD